MKVSLLAAAGILSAISQASAVTIVNPWGSTTWTAGGHGNITWTSTAAEATQKCDIYLLNGEFTNSNIVAQITNPATPVDCSAGKYDIFPLNDFAAGKYWIRIGQSATSTWAYSGIFNFVGKGTVGPASVVGTPSAAANGTAVPTAASNSSAPAVSGIPSVTGINRLNATASASGATASASASKSGAESAMSINSAAVALGAIAAIALTL